MAALEVKHADTGQSRPASGIKSNKVSPVKTHHPVASVLLPFMVRSSSFCVQGLWTPGQKLDIYAECEISCHPPPPNPNYNTWIILLN
jgi:hypothetical protein